MVLFIWDYLKPGLELYQNIVSKNSTLKNKTKQKPAYSTSTKGRA